MMAGLVTLSSRSSPGCKIGGGNDLSISFDQHGIIVSRI
jgi:hypothetical protein